MPVPLKDLLAELKSRLMALYGVRYSLEIERTSELISELSLKYHLSISRLFVTEDDWKNRDTPFLTNVRHRR